MASAARAHSLEPHPTRYARGSPHKGGKALRLAASFLARSRYCFSGTVIGLPLSATMKASTLAGSVWLAFAETPCNCPGAS